VTETEVRQCQKCGEIKPIKEFPIDLRIESMRKWKCRECDNKDQAKWREHTKWDGWLTW